MVIVKQKCKLPRARFDFLIEENSFKMSCPYSFDIFVTGTQGTKREM
jgi:hypothetical protein